MDLTEAQGKELFSRYKLPVPLATLVTSAEQAERAARGFDKVVLKAQVPFGHRKKLGAIVFATPRTVKKRAGALLSKTVRGVPIEQLLVEEFVPLEQEWYLAVTVNRLSRRAELLFTRKGGIDVERIAAKHLLRLSLPLAEDADSSLAQALGVTYQHYVGRLLALATRLYQLMRDQDALLVEVNPLGLDASGTLRLIDSKVTIDDAALFRHRELRARSTAKRGLAQPTLAERLTHAADRAGVAYVPLTGVVGVIGNGAGLVMTTVDLLAEQRTPAANFLDVGGGADQSRMQAALSIVLQQPGVKLVFINIFGGITRTDEIAAGIQAYLREHPTRVPLVVRLTGTRELEGRALLQKIGIKAYRDLQQALAAVQQEVSRVG